MSDQNNIDEIEENQFDQTNNESDNQTNLIDSLFLSGFGISIIGAIFLVLMFISGSFVFSLYNEKSKIEQAQVWIKSHDGIIESAKKQKRLLTALKDTVSIMTSEKKLLINDVEKLRDDKNSFAKERDQLRNEILSKKDERQFIDDNIRDKGLRLSSLKDQLPALEEQFGDLTNRKREADEKYQRSNDRYNEKINELNEINGRISAAKGEKERLVVSLSTVSDINSDFNNVRLSIARAANDLEEQIKLIERSNENFQNQYNSLNDINDNAKIKIEELSSELQNILRSIGSQATELDRTNNKLKGFSNAAEDITSDLKNSETSVRSLNRNINDVVKEINELGNQANILSNNIEQTSISEDLKNSETSVRSLNRNINDVVGEIDKLGDQANMLSNNIEQTSISDLQKTVEDILSKLSAIDDQLKKEKTE
jgi:chromosome segregation ATPase